MQVGKYKEIIMCCCNFDFSGLIAPFLKDILAPILVAFLAYIIINKLDEWKRNQKYSRLGISILESILEEVKTGLAIMKDLLNEKFKYQFLPKACWNELTTISDNVLLRIIEVSKDKEFKPYHPSHIRIHCKNYFEHIVGNVNKDIQLLADKKIDWNVIKGKYFTGDSENPNYIFCTEEVIKMLENTITLLRTNESKLKAK
jgi:hypothetical protein